MSKRMTDTILWDKSWFMALSPAEKCAWMFIKDRCDAVGVWEPNTIIAEAYIGAKINWDSFKAKCNGNIAVLENGKWWLVDYCTFQYGTLNEESTSQTTKYYIKMLKNHNLWDRVKEGYTKPIDTLSIAYGYPIDRLKDIDKEKEKDKDKETAETKKAYGSSKSVHLTDKDYQELLTTYGEEQTAKIIAKLDGYKQQHGKRYKSDMGAIRSWVLDAVGAAKVQQKPKQIKLVIRAGLECPICHTPLIPGDIWCEKCHASKSNTGLPLEFYEEVAI